MYEWKLFLLNYSTLIRWGRVNSSRSTQNVLLGFAVLSRLLHLKSHSVFETLTGCIFPDKRGSLWVWELRELIRGLRSVLLLLCYTLVNTHRLAASEGLLKHLQQSTTGSLNNDFVSRIAQQLSLQSDKKRWESLIQTNNFMHSSYSWSVFGSQDAADQCPDVE